MFELALLSYLETQPWGLQRDSSGFSMFLNQAAQADMELVPRDITALI